MLKSQDNLLYFHSLIKELSDDLHQIPLTTIESPPAIFDKPPNVFSCFC